MSDSLQVLYAFKNNRASYHPVVTNDTTDKLYTEAIAVANRAKMMAQAGTDRNKVIEVFKEALKIADAITNHFLKNGTIRQISSSMTTAGLNDLEIKALFNEAKVTLPD